MSDLTPDQSEAVRRLLADARSDQPVPPEVAARLDDALAELVAERTGIDSATDSPAHPDNQPDDQPDDQPPVAPVLPLRRRRWPQVLVAAAAVVAVGFGSTQLIRGGAGSDSDTGGSSSADRAVSPENNAPEAAASSPPRDGIASSGGALSGATDSGANGFAPSPQTGSNLDSALMHLGVRRLVTIHPAALLEDLSKALGEAESRQFADDTVRSAARAVRDCGPYYEISGGEGFAARYRGHLALVLAHPPLDGLRLVEVYDCQSRTPRRTVELVTLATGE